MRYFWFNDIRYYKLDERTNKVSFYDKKWVRSRYSSDEFLTTMNRYSREASELEVLVAIGEL